MDDDALCLWLFRSPSHPDAPPTAVTADDEIDQELLDKLSVRDLLAHTDGELLLVLRDDSATEQIYDDCTCHPGRHLHLTVQSRNWLITIYEQSVSLCSDCADLLSPPAVD